MSCSSECENLSPGKRVHSGHKQKFKLTCQNAYAMIQRRAKSADILTRVGNHTFRASDKGPAGRRLAGYVLALGAFTLAWYVAREGVTYLRRPTQRQLDAVINQGFVKTASEIKPTLPRVLDAITTLTDVRVEGSNMIYI
jgi:hypothetical protein